jgi:HEXXH motif-containing protein
MQPLRLSLPTDDYVPAIVGSYFDYEFYLFRGDVCVVESDSTKLVLQIPESGTVLQIDASNDGPPTVNHGSLLKSRKRVLVSNELELIRSSRFKDICEASDKVTEPDIGVASAVLQSLDLLELVWPAARREVDYFVRGIIPLSTADDHWRSGSDAHTRFVIRATIKKRALAGTAETILHEAMHCKLYSLLGAVRLYENDDTPVFRHPWRTDHRPIRGVLLGAHAFLAVAEFYKRLYLLLPDTYKFAKEAWLNTAEQVKVALQQLSDGARFTECGSKLFLELRGSFNGVYLQPIH